MRINICFPFRHSPASRRLQMLPWKGSSSSSSSSSISSSLWSQRRSELLIKQVALANHMILTVAAAVSLLPPEVFTTPPMMDVPTNAPSEQRLAISNLLDSNWEEYEGYEIPSHEKEAVLDPINTISDGNDHQQFDAFTYGEITELGARQLFYSMNLYGNNPKENNNNNQHQPILFYDLGCGVGKLVIQAYLEIPRLVQTVGVELAPSRYRVAKDTWKSIQSLATQIRNMGRQPYDASVDLQQGDLHDTNLSMATHIYVASLCFSDDMMERLGEKISLEAKALQCIATLKEFPSRFERNLGKPKVSYVEMSWTRPYGAQVYFYSPLARNR